MKYEIEIGKPNNYEDLKKKANDMTSWRNRLEAVEELKKWNCKESKDILWRRMNSDKVYDVVEAAFRGLQGFGEDVYLRKKRKGNLIKEINKMLRKVHDACDPGYIYTEFKEKFKLMYPEAYDAYEGDKKKQFDKWLENTISNFPKK